MSDGPLRDIRLIPDSEMPWLQLSGPNGAQFRAGWQEGKARLNDASVFPKGSIGRAASEAAKAFHAELRK